MMNLILIAILVTILAVIVIGFSGYNPEPVNGADTESDLSLCLRGYQGVCDKLDIEKLHKQMLEIAGITMCVDDLNEYFKQRLQHMNDTDFTIIHPCKPLDLSNAPEDESGK